MHVILLFAKTVLNQLPLPLRQRLNELFSQLEVREYELFGNKGEASILKIYWQDKFPMGNLVNLV
jgi:predicted DCC family thiol-disulfide oxidoreductase YuxK